VFAKPGARPGRTRGPLRGPTSYDLVCPAQPGGKNAHRNSEARGEGAGRGLGGRREETEEGHARELILGGRPHQREGLILDGVFLGGTGAHVPLPGAGTPYRIARLALVWVRWPGTTWETELIRRRCGNSGSAALRPEDLQTRRVRDSGRGAASLAMRGERGLGARGSCIFFARERWGGGSKVGRERPASSLFFLLLDLSRAVFRLRGGGLARRGGGAGRFEGLGSTVLVGRLVVVRARDCFV